MNRIVTSPAFKLNTGALIPSIALGTWQSPNDKAAMAVFEALKAGYRHIDTASVYGNEEGVGAGLAQGIKELGLKREDVFLTTKLWVVDFHDPVKALNASLERLFPKENNPYVDLYLMHWPFALHPDTMKWDKSIDFNQAYALMENLPESKTKAIGVSNFTIRNMKKLLSTAKVTPAVNQVELHTHLPQNKLVDWLVSGNYGSPEHDGKIIYPQAYCPLGHGHLDDVTVKKIAEKHNTQPANVVLSWGVARKTVVLPKSVTPERIHSNLKTVALDQEDMEAINNISKHAPLQRYCNFHDAECNAFNGDEDSK